MVTVPPLILVAMAAPAEFAESAFVRCIGEERAVVEVARFSVTVARTLFGIVAEFSPHKRQVALPEPFVQVSVLLTAPAAGLILADLKSVVE